MWVDKKEEPCFLPSNADVSVRARYKKEDESFENHYLRLDSNLKLSSG